MTKESDGEPVLTKDWRPKNWQQLRIQLATTPYVWSLAKPALPHIEQIIEATASLILEERAKAEGKP